MAVTLTAQELAAAIKAEDSPDLDRLLAVAKVRVEKSAPRAPVEIQNEATRLIAGYLHDRPNWSEYSGGMSAYIYSGAAALLKPWRVHRALKIEDT